MIGASVELRHGLLEQDRLVAVKLYGWRDDSAAFGFVLWAMSK